MTVTPDQLLQSWDLAVLEELVAGQSQSHLLLDNFFQKE